MKDKKGGGPVLLIIRIGADFAKRRSHGIRQAQGNSRYNLYPENPACSAKEFTFPGERGDRIGFKSIKKKERRGENKGRKLYKGEEEKKNQRAE
ncbi:MAG: hypothetical protein L0229_01720 [Blastocatellia bacterium]|nr:hypothetical protein [Blastocatellia bacterium]